MMVFLTVEEFCSGLKPTDRLLGLDIGNKTIGVACGSILGGFASSLNVIHRTKIVKDAEVLLKHMKDYECNGIVAGWPLNVDGTVGPRCQAVRDVMLEIMKHIPPVPVTFYDERFSTKTSEEFLIKSVDMSRQRRGEVVDKMAAQVILQDFMNAYTLLTKLPDRNDQD